MRSDRDKVAEICEINKICEISEICVKNKKIEKLKLRQLWQALPFLPHFSYMRRMLLCQKSSVLLE